MDEDEEIRILEEVARSSKSAGARIQAIRELRVLRAAREAAREEKPVVKEEKEGFEGLYDVRNPGRVRRVG